MACPTACDSSVKKFECKEFAIDILPATEPETWPECCIYRVPKKLRKVKEEAYTPKLVSIGPFHYHNKELGNMKIEKLRYLMEFCSRTKKTPKELASIIANEEEKIRRCYSETFELKSEEFVNMILLDAIFIINLFWRTSESKKNKRSCLPYLEFSIRHDLMLLENQLPFFVLEKLYKEGPPIEEDQKEELNFLGVSLSHFSSFFGQQPQFMIEDAKHLTDLLRKGFGDCENNDIGNRYSATKLQYSATKLQEAGLKLKVVNKEGHLGWKNFNDHPCLRCFKCFPCLKGAQRVLQVPVFDIDDNTEALFRNVMALEQCHYPSKTHICSYVLLFDSLIDNKDDVNLLVDKRIIVNQLGSNENVAKLINELGHEIVDTDPCLSKLCQELNEHYEERWNHYWAILKRVYFPDVWRGTGTIVGLFILFITLWNFLRPFIL